MKSGIPWQVEGVRWEVRDTACEAARRAGMSVGEWLDSVILNSAANESSGSKLRLEPRLDQYDADGRLRPPSIDAQDRPRRDEERGDRGRPRPTLGASPPTPLDQALSEIADRQRMLDGNPSAASGNSTAAATSAPDPLPRPHTQELSVLEQQLRQINSQIETLRQPFALDKAVDTLRDDLAEIGLMLQEAMPRNAVEALEAEVRKLADQIDHTRHAGADAAALTGIEHGLAEVRDALRSLTPAENLVGLDRAVQQLTQKVDLLASRAQDPSAFRQLESAIVAMRGIVSHAASNDALARLSDEVRALSLKVDQAAGAGGGGILSALEERIATLADALEARNHNGQSLPFELDAVVKGLVEKVERFQLTPTDHPALGHLEDRIAKLVDKLDASDARLDHLEAIERGLAELLIHLEHQRLPGLARSAPPPPAEVNALSRDIAELRQTERRTQDTLEVVHSTLGAVVDRLAMIETGVRAKPARTAEVAPGPGISPAPAQRAVPATATAAAAADADRRPIDPNLPPDHPLEPGSGATRGHNPGSPANRIAASEAALGGTRPPTIADPGGKSDFIAAARRAAQVAGRDAPARKEASAPGDITSAADEDASPVGKLRALIGGTTAVLLVLGALQIARVTLPGASDGSDADPGVPLIEAAVRPESVPATVAPVPVDPGEPVLLPPPPTPAPGRQSGISPGIDPGAAPAAGISALIDIAQQAIPTPKPGAGTPAAETTASVARPAKPAAAPASAAVPAPAIAAVAHPPTTTTPASDKLPSAFGSALRSAAARGDAAAQYEIALRYAEARGVPQNLSEAAQWFDRAARQGLVPAKFRLAGLYEKGLGVKKSLETARGFYIAAGEAGHAKAMHNLAVLHAEGIDGKPDYQTAARWFRKAADHGVTDSQYNLAVLYARGIGVEQDLAEAHKWFALAARDGDSEAAKKRDEVAARLDPQSLNAATQAVQAWRPEPQPEAAVQVKSPAGGWDAAAAPAPVSAPTRRKPPAAAPKLDLATPQSAQ